MNSLESEKPRREGSPPLSKRERQIFELLADGLSGAEIAAALVLSPETVRTHIRNAMRKLGASTRSQAVVLALQRREIAPRDDAEVGAEPRAPRTEQRPSAEQLAGPLGDLLDGLLSLWDVEAGWVYLMDDDRLGLQRVAGRDGSQAAVQRIALGDGPLGRAALDRRPQVVRSPNSDSGPVIVAPLVGGNRVAGVIGLGTRASRPAGRQELLLLQALAARVGELLDSDPSKLAAGVERAMAGFRESWAASARAH